MQRRALLRNLAASGIAGMLLASEERARSEPRPAEIPVPRQPRPGVDWVERMELGRHHLIHGVDETGLPYFDVLLRRPYAEASHSFPDFVDLVGRYWEAAMLVGEITGRPVETEPLLRKRALALFSEPDGLTYNPATRFSYYRSDITGFTRVLFALVRWAELQPSEESKRALQNAIRGIKKIVPAEGEVAWIPSLVWDRGTWKDPLPGPAGEPFATLLILRPLTEASMILKSDEPLELARRLVNGFRLEGDIGEDGRWTGHVHAHLDGIAGIVECGLLSGDRSLIEWGERAFEFLRRFGTDFGWIPELIDRADDCVGCETCSLMDYVDSALMLARSGRNDLWELVERVTRNHLLESQLTDPAWLVEPPNARDDNVLIRRQTGKRMVGAFAGWSSPLGILAYDERYWTGSWSRFGPGPWDNIESGKIRALQNCCAGSGLKGLWRVWRQSSRIADGTLVVEMPFDRIFPEARVVSRQPFGEGITVEVKTAMKVKIRLPRDGKPSPAEDVIPGATASATGQSGEAKRRPVVARRNGQEIPLPTSQGYLVMDELRPGEKLEVSFERPERKERVSIGNPGFQHYAFEVQWRGATVLKIEPSPKNPPKGFNHIMKTETTIHMKGKVEHPFYQRSGWQS